MALAVKLPTVILALQLRVTMPFWGARKLRKPVRAHIQKSLKLTLAAPYQQRMLENCCREKIPILGQLDKATRQMPSRFK